jgi:hypothetical protein
MADGLFQLVSKASTVVITRKKTTEKVLRPSFLHALSERLDIVLTNFTKGPTDRPTENEENVAAD